MLDDFIIIIIAHIIFRGFDPINSNTIWIEYLTIIDDFQNDYIYIYIKIQILYLFKWYQINYHST